jgi:hypothetical protein
MTARWLLEEQTVLSRRARCSCGHTRFLHHHDLRCLLCAFCRSFDPAEPGQDYWKDDDDNGDR